MDGGSWTFDNHLLVLYEMKSGEESMEVPLYYVNFWIQVFDLSSGFFLEEVGKALANYFDYFISYDIKNVWSLEQPFMRLRLRVDIRHPLKSNKNVRKPGGEWITCKFKFDKLPFFLFHMRLDWAYR